MPSPIFTKKLKETPETKESEEETDVEIEKTSETEETKQQEEGFIEENPSPSPFSEEKEDPDKIDETEKIRVNGKDKTKDEFHLYLQEASYKNSSTSYYGNRDNSETEKDNSDDEDDELLKIIKEENKNLFWFEKHPLVLLFDYKRWNHEQEKIDEKVYDFFNNFYAWYYEELSDPDEELENLVDELYAWWYDKHNNSIYELEYSNDDYLANLSNEASYVDIEIVNMIYSYYAKIKYPEYKNKTEFFVVTNEVFLNGKYCIIIITNYCIITNFCIHFFNNILYIPHILLKKWIHRINTKKDKKKFDPLLHT